nr:hypothetical protein [uncultured Chryseobacterium sp.]
MIKLELKTSLFSALTFGFSILISSVEISSGNNSVSETLRLSARAFKVYPFGSVPASIVEWSAQRYQTSEPTPP